MNANERKSKVCVYGGHGLQRGPEGLMRGRVAKIHTLLSALLPVVMFAGLSGFAAAGSLPDGPYISTSAEAVREVDPDFAVISLTFRTIESSAEAARAEADQAQQRLIEVLEPFRGALDDRRVESIEFGEEWDYDQTRRQRVRVGFFGQFSVNIKVTGFEQLPGLFYSLAGLEWNSLRRPRFEVEDRQSAEDAVRQLALERAIQRAGQLASASGARLGSIWGIIHEPMHERAGQFESEPLGQIRIATGFGEDQFALPMAPRPVRFEARAGVVYRLETTAD